MIGRSCSHAFSPRGPIVPSASARHELTVWGDWERVYYGSSRAYRVTTGLVAGHPYEVRAQRRVGGLRRALADLPCGGANPGGLF